MFFWSRQGETTILTLRNATLACMEEYQWSWNVAEAHVQAVNVMYARQQVGVGRITRTRTENRAIVPLDRDLQELVDCGMPQGDAVFHQETRNRAKVSRLEERKARRERGSPVSSDEEEGGAFGVVGASRGSAGLRETFNRKMQSSQAKKYVLLFLKQRRRSGRI